VKLTDMRSIAKPDAGEYAPYAIRYIGLLPDDGFVLAHMRRNLQTIRELMRSLPADRLVYRYDAGKWTIKEILLHIADDERIYAYRALRFARGEAAELPGFDQDAYARESGANERSLESLLHELGTVREATLSLFEGLDAGALVRRGVASGNPMSVRAIAYHIAGHEMRHVDIIRERYL
jgi:uncharacterized damage-inducible protein DinB